MTVFTFKDVLEIFNIERGRLNEWVKFVPGSVDEYRGKRLIRNFKNNDLYAIGLFKIIIENGVARDTAAGIVYVWRNNMTKKDYLLFRRGPDGKYILESFDQTKGALDRAYASVKLLETFEDSETWDLSYLVNMRKIKKDIDGKIKK